jgi:hypothetical protein
VKPRIFTAAAGLSAVLTALVIGWWCWSFWFFDMVDHDGGGRYLSLWSFRGTILFAGGSGERFGGYPDPGHPSPTGWNVRSIQAPEDMAADEGWPPPWGLKIYRKEYGFSGPHAALVVLTLPLPAAWLIRRMRRNPLACASCSYDLRGTPGIECPECGAIAG